ncbi:MAG: prepilin-type N-terminal cleavage/methylation domain-containing protein [Candidatus Omnitrophota bacterium]
MQKQGRAFTLIELVVVIIVLGLLATLAIPRFQKQLERGRAAEAYRMLAEIRTAQEIWKNEHGAYTENLADLGFGGLGGCSPERFFSYYSSGNEAVAERCTANRYIITINLISGNINDDVLRI